MFHPKIAHQKHYVYSMSNVIMVGEKLTLNTVTYGAPLCSVYSAPSYVSNLTLLAPFSTELAYLSMLFILDMVCTAGSADHLKNQ